MQKRDEGAYAELLPHHESNPYYGNKRLALAANMNHKKVSRLMKKFNMHAKTYRKKHGKNQYSKQKTSLPNLMREVVLTEPNQAWSGDFTHIMYQGKTYYLATVIDAYTREIVGWHMEGSHTVDLVLEALKMAVRKREKTPKIFHSDHGSEYISEAHVAELAKHSVLASYSEKGKPWQNGIQESTYDKFKGELGDVNRFGFYELFFEAIAMHIRYFNVIRIHTKLKMSPVNFYKSRMEEINRHQKSTKVAA